MAFRNGLFPVADGMFPMGRNESSFRRHSVNGEVVRTGYRCGRGFYNLDATASAYIRYLSFGCSILRSCRTSFRSRIRRAINGATQGSQPIALVSLWRNRSAIGGPWERSCLRSRISVGLRNYGVYDRCGIPWNGVATLREPKFCRCRDGGSDHSISNVGVSNRADPGRTSQTTGRLGSRMLSPL